jgi:hypothetical protein
VRQWNSTPRAVTRMDSTDDVDMYEKLVLATKVTFPDHLLSVASGLPFRCDGGIFYDQP